MLNLRFLRLRFQQRDRAGLLVESATGSEANCRCLPIRKFVRNVWWFRKDTVGLILRYGLLCVLSPFPSTVATNHRKPHRESIRCPLGKPVDGRRLPQAFPSSASTTAWLKANVQVEPTKGKVPLGSSDDNHPRSVPLETLDHRFRTYY